MPNARRDWGPVPSTSVSNELFVFFLFINVSLQDIGDGPTIVFINFFLRSISKIDDYKMVSRGLCQSCQVFGTSRALILYIYLCHPLVTHSCLILDQADSLITIIINHVPNHFYHLSRLILRPTSVQNITNCTNCRSVAFSHDLHKLGVGERRCCNEGHQHQREHAVWRCSPGD